MTRPPYQVLATQFTVRTWVHLSLLSWKKIRTEKSLDEYIMSYLKLNQNSILSYKAPLVYTPRNKHAQTPLAKSISCSQDFQPLEILLGTSCYSFPVNKICLSQTVHHFRFNTKRTQVIYKTIKKPPTQIYYIVVSS